MHLGLQLAELPGRHAINSSDVRSILIHDAGHGLGFYDGAANHGEKTVDATVTFFDRSL